MGGVTVDWCLARAQADGERARAPAPIAAQVRLLYRGLLRVLLVLLHDFPEFLSEYHFALIDAIPHTCVQMRNIVLSGNARCDTRAPGGTVAAPRASRTARRAWR